MSLSRIDISKFISLCYFFDRSSDVKFDCRALSVFSVSVFSKESLHADARKDDTRAESLQADAHTYLRRLSTLGSWVWVSFLQLILLKYASARLGALARVVHKEAEGKVKAQAAAEAAARGPRRRVRRCGPSGLVASARSSRFCGHGDESAGSVRCRERNDTKSELASIVFFFSQIWKIRVRKNKMKNVCGKIK